MVVLFIFLQGIAQDRGAYHPEGGANALQPAVLGKKTHANIGHPGILLFFFLDPRRNKP